MNAKEYHKEWRKKNAVRLAKKQSEWAANNPDYCREYRKEYRKLYPELSSYSHMMTRCYDPSHDRYKDYGGRGIRVCDSWNGSFINFREDMGKRPIGKTIDRINTNGDYTPDNCKWSTPKEQRANQRVKK